MKKKMLTMNYMYYVWSNVKKEEFNIWYNKIDFYIFLIKLFDLFSPLESYSVVRIWSLEILFNNFTLSLKVIIMARISRKIWKHLWWYWPQKILQVSRKGGFGHPWFPPDLANKQVSWNTTLSGFVINSFDVFVFVNIPG